MTILKHEKIKAKDGRTRYITVATIFNIHAFGINWGICISTKEYYNKSRGEEIAIARATLNRRSLKERGLAGTVPNVLAAHMEWLVENRKMAHMYAEFISTKVVNNINNLIWPDKPLKVNWI